MPRIRIDRNFKDNPQLEMAFQQLEDQLQNTPDIYTIVNSQQTLPPTIQRGDIIMNISAGSLVLGVWDGTSIIT